MAPSFQFPSPVLTVTADAVRDLQGSGALSSLWTRTYTWSISTCFFFY
jgi:hypothetical protein